MERLHVRPGNPIRAMLAQRMSEATEILDKLGGSCSAEYKYDGMRIQAHRTADGRWNCSPAAWNGCPASSRMCPAAGRTAAATRGDSRG